MKRKLTLLMAVFALMAMTSCGKTETPTPSTAPAPTDETQAPVTENAASQMATDQWQMGGHVYSILDATADTIKQDNPNIVEQDGALIDTDTNTYMELDSNGNIGLVVIETDAAWLVGGLTIGSTTDEIDSVFPKGCSLASSDVTKLYYFFSANGSQVSGIEESAYWIGIPVEDPIQSTLVLTSTAYSDATAGSESTNPLMNYTVQFGDVLNGAGTETIGQFAYINTSLTAGNISDAQLAEFVQTVVTDAGYQWFTIAFSDGSGIQFAGCDPLNGSYGVIDTIGRVTSVSNYISVSSDGTVTITEPSA